MFTPCCTGATSEILLNRLEEELDLPTKLVHGGDRAGGQVQILGQKHDLAFSVLSHKPRDEKCDYAPKVLSEKMADIDSCEKFWLSSPSPLSSKDSPVNFSARWFGYACFPLGS